MREQIAVLDGLSMVADGYTGREFTPSPSEGANYQGGSNWHPFTPTLPSSEGLAGGMGGLSGLGMDPVPGYTGQDYTPSPSEGANYQGGSNWHPHTPTLPSSEGLASSLSIDTVPGWAGHSVSPVPGNGQNYTGGSNWKNDFPTSVSSKGLVGLRARARSRALKGLAFPGAAPPPWRFPMWDERELAVVRAIRCGVRNAFRALFGVSYPLEVENCVQTIRAMLRQNGTEALGRAMAATRQENAYLGAFYVMSRAVVDTYRGTKSIRERALRASQMCG